MATPVLNQSFQLVSLALGRSAAMTNWPLREVQSEPLRVPSPAVPGTPSYGTHQMAGSSLPLSNSSSTIGCQCFGSTEGAGDGLGVGVGTGVGVPDFHQRIALASASAVTACASRSISDGAVMRSAPARYPRA